MSTEPTVIRPEDEIYYEVDPYTCEPLIPRPPDFKEISFDNQVWSRVRFTLFSMMVSSSIFASFNATTFYTTVVLLIGTNLRPLCIYGTWRGHIYETTHPDPLIKLIEGSYMKRHEEDLIGEEETYRMLQEILR